MANRNYTKELKDKVPLFIKNNESYIKMFFNYLQSNNIEEPVIKRLNMFEPKKKTIKPNKNSTAMWKIIANQIFESHNILVTSYLINYSKKIKRIIRFLSTKYDISIREIIKDYMFLCNAQQPKFPNRNSVKTSTIKRIAPLTFNPMLIPIISKKKETFKFLANVPKQSTLSTSLYFYDSEKEEKKVKTVEETPLNRIKKLTKITQKILQDLQVLRNNRLSERKKSDIEESTEKSIEKKKVKDWNTRSHRLLSRNIKTSQSIIFPRQSSVITKYENFIKKEPYSKKSYDSPIKKNLLRFSSRSTYKSANNNSKSRSIIKKSHSSLTIPVSEHKVKFKRKTMSLSMINPIFDKIYITNKDLYYFK